MPILGNKDAPAAPLNPEQLKKIFKEHDKNGDGRLDKEELKKAFQRLGAVIPGWRAWRGLHYADADGDGSIDESEIPSLVNYAKKFGYTVT